MIKKTFSVLLDSGSYITVYKRDDMKEPLADLNFFGGDRTIAQLVAMRIVLDNAIGMMEDFSE